MQLRLRFLPIAIVAAVGLLGVKLGSLWVTIDGASVVTPARAEQAAEKPASAHAAVAEAPATPATSLGAADRGQPGDSLSMSPAEIELLQRLSERRAELDKRAAELSQREILLEAAEKRIDEKIAKLDSLQKDIGGIVDKQTEEDEARIKSLVKIYETMKPHDAARIFEQLDMPVLLGVVEHMKERNAAPILAALDPAKAKAVTLALAERRDRHGKAEVTVPKGAQK
jgi:flagellar motility protein MotE (MotC chaperone)